MDTGSTSIPAVDGPKHFTVSDGIDAESEIGLGPSAFENSARPYLAKVFELGSQDILNFNLGDQIRSVDSFVLSLVRERNWVDTSDSYQRVLSEIKANLGIDPSLQPLLVLERLSKGVELLRLQRMHRRRDREIQNTILKLNQEPHDIRGN